MQVMSPEENAKKGIYKRDIEAMLRHCESRVNSYVSQYARNGFKCSSRFQSAWDADCARWDHLKATLRGYDEVPA